METIFCPQCGAEATSDDFACPQCESILNEAALEAEPISVVEALLSRSARKARRPAAPPPEPEPKPVARPAASLPPSLLVPRPAVSLPPSLLVPRLKGGITLTQTPLPPLEAELVSYIDGRATVAEIAGRAKLSIIEVMVTLQAETLVGSVELVPRPPPGPGQDPATLIEQGKANGRSPRQAPGATPSGPTRAPPRAELARRPEAIPTDANRSPPRAESSPRSGATPSGATRAPPRAESAPRSEATPSGATRAPPRAESAPRSEATPSGATRSPPRSESSPRSEATPSGATRAQPSPRSEAAPSGATRAPPRAESSPRPGATPSGATPAPPLPRGLRLTAPSFEELREGRGHRLAEANVGSQAPALSSRVDAFAVTQPEIRRAPMPDPLAVAPEEPPLGRPFLSYADDSDPSLVAVAAPSADARSSVQSPGEEELFQASASLSAEGRIVSAPPDTDATPVRTTPPRLPPRPVVVEDRVRPPLPRASAPSWQEEPQPELGGRNLDLAIPDDAAPLELAREVRGKGHGPDGAPFSDTRWTDSVLEEANALEREGDVAGAVQVLEQAIATAPKPAALYNRLGLVMVKRSNLVQAAVLLQKAIALEPSNSVFRRNAEKIARLSAGAGRRDR